VAVDLICVKQNYFNSPVGNYIEGGSHHQATSTETVLGSTALQEIAAEAGQGVASFGFPLRF
jgi:hypothetical protein